MGAKAGFALLWLVIVSTGVKVWVQMELARWTNFNGRSALDGYRDVGPRIGRVSWINWLWIGMDFAKLFQRGGIIGGTAAALSVLWPITGDALSFRSLAVWTVIVTLSAIGLLYSGKYGMVERACTIFVVVFTLATVFALASDGVTEHFRRGWCEGGSSRGTERRAARLPDRCALSGPGVP
nr:divalent metal cation transporter [Streptomyces sp. NBC_00830]